MRRRRGRCSEFSPKPPSPSNPPPKPTQTAAATPGASRRRTRSPQQRPRSRRRRPTQQPTAQQPAPSQMQATAISCAARSRQCRPAPSTAAGARCSSGSSGSTAKLTDQENRRGVLELLAEAAGQASLRPTLPQLDGLPGSAVAAPAVMPVLRPASRHRHVRAHLVLAGRRVELVRFHVGSGAGGRLGRQAPS